MNYQRIAEGILLMTVKAFQIPVFYNRQYNLERYANIYAQMIVFDHPLNIFPRTQNLDNYTPKNAAKGGRDKRSFDT